MRPNQPRWYVVKEERARQFAALNFSIKQKANGKFMVLCRPQDLFTVERDRKGMVPTVFFRKLNEEKAGPTVADVAKRWNKFLDH